MDRPENHVTRAIQEQVYGEREQPKLPLLDKAQLEDLEKAFCLTFLNKCEETERPLIAEYYQRCFGKDIPESMVAELA